MKRKWVSLFLAVSLVVSLGGCNLKRDNTKDVDTAISLGEDSKSADKEIELTVWNQDAPTNGIQNNSVADEIAEKTGVRINIVKGDAEKFQVLLSAGDLPDIIYYNSSYGSTPSSLVNTGQLLKLDDLVKNYGANIKSNFPDKLEYSKRFISNTDELYFIPENCYESQEDAIPAYYGAGISFMGRWDLYAKAGYPQVTNEDEYLDMLEKMQKENPATADGKKVYAMGAWSNWEIWPYWVLYEWTNGYEDSSNYTITNKLTGEIENRFYSQQFWNAIRFYNKAYNKGLMDPESFTQTFDDYSSKAKNGQYIQLAVAGGQKGFNEALAAIDPSMGYEIIPTGMGFASGLYTNESPYGWGAPFAAAITKNCKNPEKAMELINYLNGAEGSRLLKNGVEGVHWKMVEGVPLFTEEYLEKSKADPDYKQNEGIGAYNYLAGISGNQIIENSPVDINNSEKIILENLIQVDKDYTDYYGKKYGKTFDYPGRVMEELVNNGEYTTSTEYLLTNALMGSPSDDTNTILTQVNSIMQVQVPQVIMLSPDKLEDGIKATIDKIDAAGYSEATKEIDQLILEAQKAAENFK